MQTNYLHSNADYVGGRGSQYDYNSELQRLSSYSSHLNRHKNYSVLILARDGFSNSSTRSSEIQCYSCGYTFNLDTDQGDPITNHRKRIPPCKHVQHQNAITNGFSGNNFARLDNARPTRQGTSNLSTNGSDTYLPEASARYCRNPHRDNGEMRPSPLNSEQSDGEVNLLSRTFSGQSINHESNGRTSNELLSSTTSPRHLRAESEILTSANTGSHRNMDRVIPFTDYRLELCRLQSFKRWPSNAAASPEALANAGFFYLGRDDRVECAFCKGLLRCWEPNDKPLAEHLRHFPHCPYLIDPVSVGNVPLGEEDEAMLLTVQMRDTASDATDLTGIMMDRPVQPTFANIAARLASFSDFPSNSFQRPEDLAHAGLYYTGQIDAVRCFFCNCQLHNLREHSDPWVEHVKASSKCGFVLMNKGEDYVKRVLDNKQRTTTGNASESNGKAHRVIKHKVEADQLEQIMSSPMVRSVIEMGNYTEELVRQVIQTRLQELGDQFPNAEALGDGISDYMEYLENNAAMAAEEITVDGVNTTSVQSSKTTKPRAISPVADPNNIFESSKESFVCKVCLDKLASIVFLKCGHLVCCNSCAPELTKCPICREKILGTICVDM